MGVGSRVFQTFLCDACGREVIAEEGQSVDGYYIEVLQVLGGQQNNSENVYACSDLCVERAIRDALKREFLPPEQKITETQELWLRGQAFRTNPSLPVLDASDDTRVIGTAQVLSKPSPSRREIP